MPKKAKKHERPKPQPETLKGWQQIAGFLGEPQFLLFSDGPQRECLCAGKAATSTPRPQNWMPGSEKNRASLYTLPLRTPTLRLN